MMQFNVLEDEEQSGTTSDLPVTSWEDSVCVLGGWGVAELDAICLGFGKNVFCRRVNSVQFNAVNTWQ